MEQQLLQLLADTQASAPGPRKNAEATLESFQSNPSFPICLAAIAAHASFAVNLRQSALLVLKTYVLATWSSEIEEFKGHVYLSDEQKANFRIVLLELATSATDDRKVKAAASYVVSKIAAADFPEHWPDLLSKLLQKIPNAPAGSLHGALKVLGDLVEDGFDEDQFFASARDVVTTVYGVAVNDAVKTSLRALAVSVFRSCFDMLEMLMENHKAAIKTFADEALSAWSPFFIQTMKAPMPVTPKEEDEKKEGGVEEQWRGVIALKFQVVKTLMKIRTVFPTLLQPQSPALFAATWEELSTIQGAYHELFITDERQGRLEDADGLPYTLDFLVLEELDFMQTLLKAPPVKAELQKQLQPLPDGTPSSNWIPEVMKLVVSYAQITCEEEGLWDIDVNMFLSEETSVTANYTPRTGCGDLVIKLGEWMPQETLEGLMAYTKTVFADINTNWRAQEACLFLLSQLLRDFSEVDKYITFIQASQYTDLITFCLQQDAFYLRARAHLAAGVLTKTVENKAFSNEAFMPIAQHYLEASLRAITDDPSEVVQVSCIRVLQDYFNDPDGLPRTQSQPMQQPAINAISEFISSHDIREMIDGDDLLVTMVESLRDVIVVDTDILLSSNALDVLFNIASSGASIFQVSMLVTETFEIMVEQIASKGGDGYARLCEKVLPSLAGAIDVAKMTGETALVNLATELLAGLAENSPSPLTPGFVAAVLPKLSPLLLTSTEGELLRPATLCVKSMIARDPDQFLAFQNHLGKSALEITLMVIDRLLGPTVDDNAAAEVGSLAAELVEKAGFEKLGPYFEQLLRAVAIRLATAEQAGFIQSLCLVFARLSLISPKEVVDFLSTIDVNGNSGLHVVLTKWLENSVHFAGFTEIRQNVIALSKLYALEDPRIIQTTVKGDLIVDNTNRIKTRSQARANPDRYTLISAALKILKLLVEELASSNRAQTLDAAAAAALDEDGSEDGDDWEDMPVNVLDLNSNATKDFLMRLGDGESLRSGFERLQDDETQAYLLEFFRGVADKKGFQDDFMALSQGEQERLRALAEQV